MIYDDNEEKFDNLIEVNQFLEMNSQLNKHDKNQNLSLNSICKIIINTEKRKGCGTGFFIKFEKNKKGDFYYFLMTCEHVIQKEDISKGIKVIVRYYFENHNLEIDLNSKKRTIRDFKYIDLDVTIIEILPKDNINKDLFLQPNDDYKNGYKQFEKKEIYIPQFPKGEMSSSEGVIESVFPYLKKFFHSSSTDSVSSGSPILLKNCLLVLSFRNTLLRRFEYKKKYWPIHRAYNRFFKK